MIGSTAFLFPGQGSDLCDLAPATLVAARPLLDLTSQLLGQDLWRALGRRDPVLSRTEVAQPALVAVSLALAQEREAAGLTGEAAAGHSLGELAAVAYAGGLTTEQAIGAAVERGRLMAEAARSRPGTMVAIRCDSEPLLERALEHGRRHGSVCLAARNSASQWVLSGERVALGAVLARVPGTLLPVAGAWHSPAMASVAAAWEPTLRRLPWRPTRRRLVLGGRAAFAAPDTDLATALLEQLTRPVLWKQSVEALAASGCSRFVAVGPGRVLRGLCREILGAGSQVVLA